MTNGPDERALRNFTFTTLAVTAFATAEERVQLTAGLRDAMTEAVEKRKGEIPQNGTKEEVARATDAIISDELTSETSELNKAMNKHINAVLTEIASKNPALLEYKSVAERYDIQFTARKVLARSDVILKFVTQYARPEGTA